MIRKPTHPEQGVPTNERPSYVRDFAAIALESSDVSDVIHQVGRFVETEHDLGSLLPHVPTVVRRTWSLREGEWLTQRSTLRHLDAMAFEAFGASVNRFCAEGFIPAEAAILWTMLLSTAPQNEGTGTQSAIYGLCDFVIAPEVPSKAVLLIGNMSIDLLGSINAEVLPESLLLAACCHISSKERSLLGRISSAIRHRPNYSEVLQSLRVWREIEKEAWQVGGMLSAAFPHFRGDPTIEVEYGPRMREIVCLHSCLVRHVESICRSYSGKVGHVCRERCVVPAGESPAPAKVVPAG